VLPPELSDLVAVPGITDCFISGTRTHLIADLAALTGADNLAGIVAGYPCDTATEIVLANGASLVSCRIVGEALSVSVSKKALGFELVATSKAAPWGV
jgi:secretion/DNA translocation related TadE-like protein